MDKLRSAVKVRKQEILHLLKTEPFNVAESLAETITSLYHENKSEILKKFPSFNEYTISISSAALIDSRQLSSGWMSHIVKHLKNLQMLCTKKYPIISRIARE